MSGTSNEKHSDGKHPSSPRLEAITSLPSSLANEHGNALDNFVLEGEKDLFQVPLREFLHEAELQRQVESTPEWGSGSSPEIPFVGFFLSLLKNKKQAEDDNQVSIPEINETKDNETNITSESISESLSNANRLVKSASWGSVFFLITTDILGPTSAPYAVSKFGYVPGSLLFLLFGAAAVYTGFIIWYCFLKLDSVKYPLRNYGDMVGRICGKTTKYGCDLLQCVQLLCNVAVIVLGNGIGLSQMAKGKGCYTVLILVWSIIGMIITQIRSLQKFGFLANCAIWMNVTVIIITMVSVAHSHPNYSFVELPKGPVITHAVISGAGSEAFQNQLSAAMNIVYSYGGAMVFVEFMAEMRRPYDFWKGMICAQSFIFSVYLLYGLFVYSQQGQFVANPANQGIDPYGLQTAVNAINLVSSIIAAGLYGNVGIKVVYKVLIQSLFRAPDLTSKYGRWIWIPTVVIYYGIAYIVGAAIPQFSDLETLVGAICILQFSYTFPPLFKFFFDIQLSAIEIEDETGVQTNGFKKWLRAYGRRWFMNTFHILFFFAALATAALGVYSGVELFKEAISAQGSALSFSCKAPYGL